ncbi:MAG TPA: CBS domain-containing protein [Chloroflexi bacterium]|nr:CBS domain-containing protein [Chloroflexota bacterium]
MEVILTHENADFDAIASLLGASKLFPAATPVLPRRVNRNGRAFLALYGAELPMIEEKDLPRRRQITRAILVDTQGLNTLKGMKRNLRVDVIDHHERDQKLPENWTFTGEPLGATTTLLVEEISGRALKLTSIEATLLLLGIYEDTGSLSYETTSPRDVRAAAWLMEQGARLSEANKFLHHPLAPEQRDLYEQLLEQSDTREIEGHHILVAWAEAPRFDEEISTLAHKLRDLLEPSALFVLVGLNDHVQMVARSATDDIDVSKVARHFGGGGHKQAAAALVRERPLQAVREELIDLLSDIVQPSTTVAQIMSWGVQVLSPDDTIAEAAHRMQRTGHEGYPVVDAGRVVGLLTRRAVDRAQQFKMLDKPVSQVMEAGAVTVESDDSVAYLQQLMIESGWGQIPVVENDQVVGVVTRTDLITLWGSTPPSPRQREFARLLEQAFPAPVLALVRCISREASDMDVVPYFVGGLVRDLILKQPIFDIDMVIEGDAIALARRLAQQLGGRVTTHRRFGTAKWLLSSQVWRQVAPHEKISTEDTLPPSVDFVTARTEFYTHPSALPQVERSSIKQDLHRRDFTINTLAIRLDPEHWGEILDFYGGEADMDNRVIRVLHSLSFVDDPTRMLRAARLECRLGFHLDPRSEELISKALPLLKRVSGDRIRHELALIFCEPEPEQALCRLQALDILPQIHPDLRCDTWLQEKYTALRQSFDAAVWDLKSNDCPFLHLALLTYRLDKKGLTTLIERLKVPRSDADDLHLLFNLRQALPQLGKARRPSAVYHLLQPYPSQVLGAAWLLSERARLRQRIYQYQTEWRQVEPELTGDDLKAMGLEPGPIFGRLLETLRDARLDGKVSTREEEICLLKRKLKAEETSEV